LRFKQFAASSILRISMKEKRGFTRTCKIGLPGAVKRPIFSIALPMNSFRFSAFISREVFPTKISRKVFVEASGTGRAAVAAAVIAEATAEEKEGTAAAEEERREG
jgi:hypothetical protein